MRRKIDKIHLFIIIISLCIISFSLSIVYAALGSVLTMTTSKVTQSALTWNMGIQSGSITGVATGNITEMECGTATATTSQITGVKMKLTKTGDKCTYAFNLKNSDNDLWKTTMIISVIGTICGVVLLFNPFAGAVLLMRIVGIFIIVYAILDAVSTFIIKKNVEEFKNVIESQSAKVKEADIVEEKETDEKANKKKNAKNVKKGKRKNNNEEK